jgi:drug/metabolite transporter (DMT)-like permease
MAAVSAIACDQERVTENDMRGMEVIFTLVSVFMIACGQLLFKLAARDVTYDGFTLQAMLSWLSPAMLAALAISTIATGLWVWVLRTADLSVVYPLYALTFVLVPILDGQLSGTGLVTRHWAGAAAIVGGVWLMTGATA